MIKLDNWNAWCNDKIVLHDIEGLEVLINLNTVLHLQKTPEGTTVVSCTEGYEFEVKETIVEILSVVSEVIDESEARRKALEDAQRAQYAEQMKAMEAEKAASEG